MKIESRYFSNIQDEYIKSLPVSYFQGNIHLIDDISGIGGLKLQLQQARLLGFDTETKPSFRKGRSNKVAMIQLATSDDAFLFRLNMIAIPDYIIDIFENQDIIKAGVALHDDLSALRKLRAFQPAGFIELQHYVKQFGIADNALKKIVANVLGFRISKKLQTSNWEQPILSPEQLTYAATDAWVCHEVYRQLDHMSLQ
jgi:ribonuclease D